MKLVPNRECGDCTVCCHHIPINQPDMVKLPNIDCDHLLKSGGCAIYKTRPETCATWYCGWRYSSALPDEWRPDKSGVLIEFSLKGMPSDFQAKSGLNVKIIDKEKALANNQFLSFITAQVRHGIAVTLSYGRDPGHTAASAFLNHALKSPIEERDESAAKEVMDWIMNELENLPKKKYKIENDRLVIDTQ